MLAGERQRREPRMAEATRNSATVCAAFKAGLLHMPTAGTFVITHTPQGPPPHSVGQVAWRGLETT